MDAETIEQAFKCLGLKDTAKPDAIRRAWYAVAEKLHPDKGGDAAKFAEASKHYRNALRWADERPCGKCGGTGKVRKQVRGGFGFTESRCGCSRGRG